MTTPACYSPCQWCHNPGPFRTQPWGSSVLGGRAAVLAGAARSKAGPWTQQDPTGPQGPPQHSLGLSLGRVRPEDPPSSAGQCESWAGESSLAAQLERRLQHQEWQRGSPALGVTKERAEQCPDHREEKTVVIIDILRNWDKTSPMLILAAHYTVNSK